MMLIYWAIFPALILAVAVVVAVLLREAYRMVRPSPGKSPLGRSSLKAIGCAAIPLIGLVALILVPTAYLSLRPSSFDFEEGFGSAPNKSIEHLRGQTEAGGDFRTIYLAFDGTGTARDFIARLTSGAQQAGAGDLLAGDISSGQSPAWFNAAPQWVGKHACADGAERSFGDWRGWRNVVIVDCRSDGKIYALFETID